MVALNNRPRRKTGRRPSPVRSVIPLPGTGPPLAAPTNARTSATVATKCAGVNFLNVVRAVNESAVIKKFSALNPVNVGTYK